MPFIYALIFANYAAMAVVPYYHSHESQNEKESVHVEFNHSVCALCTLSTLDRRHHAKDNRLSFIPPIPSIDPLDIFIRTEGHRLNLAKLFRLAPKIPPPIG